MKLITCSSLCIFIVPLLCAARYRCLWCFRLTCGSAINILHVAELMETRDFLLYLRYLSQSGLVFFLLVISTWWVNCVGKQPAEAEKKKAENMTSGSARSIVQFRSVCSREGKLDGKGCPVRGSCFWWWSLGTILNHSRSCGPCPAPSWLLCREEHEFCSPPPCSSEVCTRIGCVTEGK